MSDSKEVAVAPDVEKTFGSPKSPSVDVNDEAKPSTRLGPAPFPPAREALFLAVLCSTQFLMQAAFGSVLVP